MCAARLTRLAEVNSWSASPFLFRNSQSVIRAPKNAPPHPILAKTIPSILYLPLVCAKCAAAQGLYLELCSLTQSVIAERVTARGGPHGQVRIEADGSRLAARAGAYLQ